MSRHTIDVIAGPFGQMCASATILGHVGESRAEAVVMSAFEEVLASGTRTPDPAGTATTEESTDAVLDRVRQGEDSSGTTT